MRENHGAVAQLGERRVRNAKVGGSSPLGSTKNEKTRTGRCASFFVFGGRCPGFGR